MSYLSKYVSYIWKAPLTSTSEISSNSGCISWIIDSKLAIHESPRRKPDWKGVKNLLLIK